MKNLIIIGAGGMGRSVYSMVVECDGYNVEYVVKGFIDNNLFSLEGFDDYPPVLGTIDDYIPQENDIFICSIGDIIAKKRCCEQLSQKGAVFITIVHPLARVVKTAKLGKGVIVAPYATVNANSVIGNHVLVQTHSVVSHDVVIGDWTRIDTHVVCIGGIKIGSKVMVHTRAIINHNVLIEDEACVGAGSFVVTNVRKGTSVFGNPAREFKIKN